MQPQSIISARAEVDPERVWTLLASPACWPAWAPHMTHVTRPGEAGAPDLVHVGQRLHITTVVPLVGIGVTVTKVDEGERWDMDAPLPLGVLTASHTLGHAMDSALVTVTLSWKGPAVLGRTILQAYRPLAQVSVRRLVRLAASEEQGAALLRRRLCL